MKNRIHISLCGSKFSQIYREDEKIKTLIKERYIFFIIFLFEV